VVEKQKKVMIVFGTRPEAIKLAPIIKQFNSFQQTKLITVVTAQHREMLDQVLELFKIVPDFDLNLMKDNQSLFDITITGLSRLQQIFQEEKPDFLLVQGDTTTTMAACLGAYYLNIKMGHVEAGLRTGIKNRPFPEEMNRRIVDCLVDLYFTPTESAKSNLLNEGVDRRKIYFTGNTVIDAMFMIMEKLKDNTIQGECARYLFNEYGISIEGKKYLLVTVHRRESFGPKLKNICLALQKIIQFDKKIEIIFPVHLNPNVQHVVRENLRGFNRVHLIKPLEYIKFLWLMSKSYLVLTDSGGIQEEAPTFKKPVLVLRDVKD